MTEIVQAPAPWVERMQTANRMLAEIADDPFRASRVWDFAEAVRVYAIQVGLGVEAVNHAVAVKLKAQRLLAEAVDKGQAEGEIATRGKPKAPAPGGFAPKTLDEIGVQQQRVSEARKIRDAFTDADIDTAAADATLNGEELTSAQMLARAREVAARPVQQYVAADPRVQRAKYIQAFTNALPRVFQFDPADAATNLSEEDADHLRSVAAGFADWVERFEKARRGLRVVQGGQA